VSKSMRLVFFTLPGLIVRFNWRFPIGTHRSSASHACNRAADHFIVQPCPHAVGVVIDRAVFTNTKMLCRLDGVNIGAEEQEFPTILALLVLDHLLNTSAIIQASWQRSMLRYGRHPIGTAAQEDLCDLYAGPVH